MKRWITLCILALLFSATTIWAGTTGKLVGKVVDKATGEPLIGVNVFLEGTSLGATTDLDGNYLILNIPPGKYTVIVQYVGYQEIRMTNVPIKIDLTTTRNFEMQEAALELEDAIVVEGQRKFIQKDITASQASVGSEEIENLPVTELDDLLQLQAGINRDAGGGFHIRGGRSSEIAYWINGVPVTDSYDNSQGVQIDNNSIQELQVISGTFNAEYGNAMSGIVNSVTKEGGKKYDGDIQIYFGDYASDFTSYYPHIDEINPVENRNVQGSLSGPIPFTSDKVTFFATARYNYSDGYLYGTRYFEPTGQPGDSAVVPMDWSERITGHGKLTYRMTDNIKLNAELLASRNDFQDYGHDYRWNPDGDVNKFSRSYTGWLSMTHTLSNRTFYEINVSHFNKTFEEYLYEDPNDSRYLHPDSFIVDRVNLSFLDKGTNLHRFYRETNTTIFKGDLTSQVTNRHLIKAGVQGKIHDLSFDDYNLEPRRVNNVPVEPFEPAIPDEDSPNRTQYNQNPLELSAYIQDKIEFESVIINAGIRLDYFNSNAQVLVDPRDPNINNPLRTNLDTTNLEAEFYKDATPKWQISPRFGIAYPISATGVIHFSYGHFLQIPSFQYLYNNGDYEVPQTGSNHGIY
ncbi:MAG: TonB-dependent receptor plug domain-containing protein, partial [Caldithrix sp.]|nr:TonB-dependent receptor plug domain-containing protein [Caldithrix sp.]